MTLSRRAHHLRSREVGRRDGPVCLVDGSRVSIYYNTSVVQLTSHDDHVCSEGRLRTRCAFPLAAECLSVLFAPGNWIAKCRCGPSARVNKQLSRRAQKMLIPLAQPPTSSPRAHKPTITSAPLPRRCHLPVSTHQRPGSYRLKFLYLNPSHLRGVIWVLIDSSERLPDPAPNIPHARALLCR